MLLILGMLGFCKENLAIALAQEKLPERLSDKARYR